MSDVDSMSGKRFPCPFGKLGCQRSYKQKYYLSLHLFTVRREGLHRDPDIWNTEDVQRLLSIQPRPSKDQQKTNRKKRNAKHYATKLKLARQKLLNSLSDDIKGK